MNYDYVKRNSNRISFLGLCPQKGFMYSEDMGAGLWRVLSLNDGEVNELIRYHGMTTEEYAAHVEANQLAVQEETQKEMA